MYVKQIDQKAALELAARGKEVLVMVPAGKWIPVEKGGIE